LFAASNVYYQQYWGNLVVKLAVNSQTMQREEGSAARTVNVCSSISSITHINAAAVIVVASSELLPPILGRSTANIGEI
jgi:hypothetical protein